MGISGSELVVLLLVGFLVVGPEKLPELSRQLARIVRKVAAVARDTGDKVRAELGDDLEDLKSLDPRQYDPRRIVADAMKEPARTAGRAGTATGAGSSAAATGSAAGVTATASSGAGPGQSRGTGAVSAAGADERRRPDPFDQARPAPHDPDAT
ncbi:twin-arginine translocase TatA/TatE family subunit [Georgenia sp. Z1344]|uniref:twin-arginine translocase TatA/TatE family subunit n=1 Tax=Georgenia sp. Z1344 TaxID=3416706 RepID=UPI003CF574BE